MGYRFSVIIPTLNEEVYLPRLLESLRKQTFKDFEVIVVDAKSEDKTVERTRGYQKYFKSLKVIESKMRGVSIQRNLGEKNASGDWLVFLDADTQLLPKCLAIVNDHCAKNNDDIITGWFLADNTFFEDLLSITIGTIWLEMYAHSNYPWAPGAFCVVRPKTFEALHGFKEKMTMNEDMDLSIRCVRSGFKFAIIRAPIFRYSQRRFRKFGYLKTAGIYVKSGVSLISKGIVKMPKFVAGGHLYAKKKLGFRAK